MTDINSLTQRLSAVKRKIANDGTSMDDIKATIDELNATHVFLRDAATTLAPAPAPNQQTVIDDKMDALDKSVSTWKESQGVRMIKESSEQVLQILTDLNNTLADLHTKITTGQP